VGGFNLKLKSEPTTTQVIAELEQAIATRSWKEVVFTGFGEPTERLDVLLEVTVWIKKRYGSSLAVRLDTNGHGYLLNEGRDIASELKAAGVDKVSVSLNGYNEETYRENCRPAFKCAFVTVIDFIKKAKKAGIEVEVSAVRMPEVDIEKVKAVVDSLGVGFRVRDYIPCFW